MLIAVVNESAYLADKLSVVDRIAKAIHHQLTDHVDQHWGGHSAVIFCPDPKAIPDGACRLAFLDHPDQADALGYHDQVGNRPYGKVFVEPILDQGATLTDGPNSLSVTASHEGCEIAGDENVNLWVQMPSGKLTSKELCDAVEDESYEVLVGDERVSVSDFLLPAWFDGQDKEGPFDYLGVLMAPFTRTEGGYMIVMDGGKVDNVVGARYPRWKFGHKARHGRTGRRARCGGATKMEATS